MNNIRVQNLTKKFGKEKILDSLNFTIKENTITVLIGPSGQGKSTVLKCLMGMYIKDKGTITIGKHKLSNLVDIAGFSFQDNSFYNDLTLMENMRYFSIQRGFKDEEKIHKNTIQLLEEVKLLQSKDEYAKNLSGGMQKRLDIAISMIGNPALLILDEPTTGLDSDLRHLIYLILRNYKRKNKTVLFTTHLIDEVKDFADEAIVMNNQTIHYCGPINKMKSHWNLSIGITMQFNFESVQNYVVNQNYDVLNLKFNTKNDALEAFKKIKKENDAGIKSIKLEKYNIKNYM